MTTLDTHTLDVLKRSLEGRLLQPGEESFAESTFLWNAMIDRTPAVVVRASDASDVVAAVDFARGQGMPVSVRGGGHNIAGPRSRPAA